MVACIDFFEMSEICRPKFIVRHSTALAQSPPKIVSLAKSIICSKLSSKEVFGTVGGQKNVHSGTKMTTIQIEISLFYLANLHRLIQACEQIG
jgi:hypothetical protein